VTQISERLEQKHRKNLYCNTVSHFKLQSCHERWTLRGSYGLFIRAHACQRGRSAAENKVW
jgi:hypothetical protein